MQKDNPFVSLESPLNATIEANEKRYLYFGGTAYLGIPQNEAFLALYLDGIKRFGLNNGTSRGNNVQLGIYNQVEAYAAKRFDAEAALITSSGFLAAQMAVKQLSAFSEVRYAPATHPALWQHGEPAIALGFNEWAEAVVKEINGSATTNWLLVSNSMNNLRPEIYDFSFVDKIHPNKKIVLIIDDSHGISINNEGASALAAVPRARNVAVVVVASMAKALGVDAGLILGPAGLIGLLKNSSAFAGASPPTAAGLFAFLHAENIYEAARQKLIKNMATLRNALEGDPNWEFISEFPVFFSKNADLSSRLLERQILISSFPYPDQHGEIVNRIVLSSWHDTPGIQYLINSLQ